MDKTNVVDIEELKLVGLERGPKEVKAQRKPRLDRPVQKIRVEDIVEESPLQSRQETFNTDRYQEDKELLESIKTNGVLEPIMVSRISEIGETARYRVVFGHRRVRASRMAGLDEITAIIASLDDRPDILTLAENIGGRELTPYEKAISLVELSKQREYVTVRDLSKMTGINFGSVSDLINAYKGSPPVLRGLFAEGAGARTIVELQKVFEKLDEKEQKEIAKQLQGVSTRKAEKIRRMVEEGLSPFHAVETVMGEGGKPVVDRRKKGKIRDKASMEHLLTDDQGQIEALAAYTGANVSQVKRLVAKANKNSASVEEITIACAYRARGGRANNDLELASKVTNLPRMAKLVKRQLDHASRSKKIIETIEDEKLRMFVSTIVYGTEQWS
jgi:ParB family chromosome partitioning protein